MDIGRRIRQLRVRNGLTQEELASRCELTKGFVSQLENNLTTPSLPALMDLVEALGTDMSSFFSEEQEQKVVFGEEDYFEDVRENCRILWVVPNAQKNAMEPILLTIQPHCASRSMTPHEGEEFGYVLSGRIALYRQETRFDVKAGESFYYEADKPHRIENPGSRPARFLWISTPPSF